MKIVSENQLEYVIKLCNTYAKSVRCSTDPNISAYKGINILLDMSEFDQIKKINMNTQKCKMEPGTTFSKLYRELLLPHGFYVPFVVPGLNEDVEKISIDQAV